MTGPRGLDLRGVAARAAFWWERRDGPYVPERDGSAAVTGTLVEQRTERWRQAVDCSRRDNLARRLAWDGLDPGDLGQLLGPVVLADEAALPDWAATLAAILAETAAASGDEAPSDGLLDHDDPLPFEDLWLPVVVAARRMLAREVAADRRDLLAPAGRRCFERGLLRRLCELGAHVVHAELTRDRPAGLLFLDRALPERAGSGSTSGYERLVRRHLDSGLCELFDQYPVLARWVATTVRQWLQSTAELLERLEGDLPDLVETFGGGNPAGGVSGAEVDLSDRHRDGRTTAILTFTSGMRVVYKPKELGGDVLFQRLLEWCNRRRDEPGGMLAMRTTRVLARRGYGWVEVIERRPCADREAVRRFYRRAGQLLALVYAVQGTDCHMENLIADGEHLVLVDHETLFFPVPRLLNGERQARVDERLGSSVLTTGFLPRWELNEERLAFDSSGFGDGTRGEHAWSMPCWREVNTDDMRRGRRRVTGHQGHRPWLEGCEPTVLDHAAEVVAGFRAAYRLLLEHRHELLAPGGPLDGLDQVPIRFIFRRTQVYAHLLESSRRPERLGDGADLSLELDLLSRAFLAENERSHAWPVLQAELESLGRLDVPFFFHLPVDRDLRWPGGTTDRVLPGYFERSSREQVEEGLGRLGEADLQWQSRVLETVLTSREVHKPVDRSVAGANDAGALSDDEAVAEALRLADQIHAAAIEEADGTTGWIGLSFAPRVEVYQLESLDPQLYHGVSGIALFLAALHRVTGQEEHRDLALRALLRVRREAADEEVRERVVRRLGIGGISGVASVVYALTGAAGLLDEPDLLRTASVLARTISTERIAEDRHLDVVGGAAGALLALLVLEEAAPAGDGLAERATACGDRLLQARVRLGAERAWPAPHAARPLTGFAHGAAGMAWALARLYRRTGEERFLRGAAGGISYEQSLFSEAANNWPDLREPGARAASGFMTSWCHGAPGIGLARAAGLDVIGDDGVHRDIEAAVRTTSSFGMGDIDSMCCGTFGRIEVLASIGRRIGRDELVDEARRMAGQAVRRARQAGGYRALSRLPLSATPPGLFMGHAGVGYALLRITTPELPSVLTLE